MGVDSGRGRNPTPSASTAWSGAGFSPPRRTGIRCRNSARSSESSLGPSPGTSVRKASYASRAGEPPRTPDARRPRPTNGRYGGINRWLGREIGFQATIRTGKSLGVGFRPLPESTPSLARIAKQGTRARRLADESPISTGSGQSAGVVISPFSATDPDVASHDR